MITRNYTSTSANQNSIVIRNEHNLNTPKNINHQRPLEAILNTYEYIENSLTNLNESGWYASFCTSYCVKPRW